MAHDLLGKVAVRRSIADGSDVKRFDSLDSYCRDHRLSETHCLGHHWPEFSLTRHAWSAFPEAVYVEVSMGVEVVAYGGVETWFGVFRLSERVALARAQLSERAAHVRA